MVLGGVLYNITTGSLPPPVGNLNSSELFTEKIWKDERVVQWDIQVMSSTLSCQLTSFLLEFDHQIDVC